MYPLLKKMGNIFRIIKELLHAQSVSILRITRLEKNYVFLIKCKIIHFVKKNVENRTQNAPDFNFSGHYSDSGNNKNWY